MKRFFKKMPGCLVPAYEEDERWLTGKKVGAFLEVDIREPRNGKLLAKWWSLANFLAEHSNRFPNSEYASKYMLIQLGYYTMIRTPEGGGIPIADSISFANMSEDTFSEVFNNACELLCRIIPHVTDENVRQVLEGYAGVATEQR